MKSNYKPTSLEGAVCLSSPLHGLQVDDLLNCEFVKKAPSVVFEKRDRSLRNAVYTIVAFDPEETVRIKGTKAESTHSSGRKKAHTVECPFRFLDELQVHLVSQTDLSSVPSEVDFAFGLIGYMGFGLVNTLENVPRQSADPLGVPDALLMAPNTVIYIDHVTSEVHVISRKSLQRARQISNVLELMEKNSVGRVKRASAAITPGSHVLEAAGLSSVVSKNEFLNGVRQSKKFVEEGQCFQIVLSQRFTGPALKPALDMFASVLETSASTYNYLLNFEDFQYVGASPETMLSGKAGAVRLCALAGTRPRGVTPQQDDDNETELRSNKKEMAEHMMLVDLGRNDLGKVCAPGSIRVGQIAQVLRYTNVMHLGTEIYGTLESQETVLSALKACFPRGTVSGAPKIRALELLSKLEPEQRGIYAGAVGFVDPRGILDTAIAIRGALIKDGSVHINAGAGIVYDSDPESEYMETINKASAIASVCFKTGRACNAQKPAGSRRSQELRNESVSRL